MTYGLMPDADAIAAWSARVSSTAELPRLVRRLISGTAEINHLAVRAGSGIRFAGWDGTAEVARGNAWVPDGLSSWEMGTNADAAAKASEDYLKRTRETEEAIRRETVFVFVSSRRWDGKDAWALRRRRRNQWRDVLVVDADDLEGWLETTYFVYLWLSERVSGRIRGVKTLESAWQRWSDATTPAVSPALLRAGREDLALALRDVVDGPAVVKTVQAESADEALAFIAASFLEEDNDANVRLTRAVVVTDEEAWAELVAQPKPLILIPTFPEPHFRGATRAGHHVLVPIGTDAEFAPHFLLSELDFDLAVIALRDMGFGQDDAERHAGSARRNLFAFRRQLATEVPLAKPPWAEPPFAHRFVPALLAGTWDDREAGDSGVMATLAERPYGEVESDLRPWTEFSDPPLRLRGSTWALTNREDAWNLLGDVVSAEDWSRFVRVAVEVLGSADPAWELTADQRWAAAIHGKSRPHSATLRQGIAETVAMLGGWPPLHSLRGGRRGPVLADSIVRELLGPVNADVTGGGWAALGDVLPYLAEAAPSVFLAAVDDGLSGETPALVQLIAEADAGGIFGRASHAGALWGLESLAWSRDHLESVAIVLARWAGLDPGGQWANRPANTFRSLFLPWYPQTNASVEDRLSVIDSVRRRVPGASWSLMLGLLPKKHDIASNNARPRWRPWVPEHRGATLAARNVVTHAIAERLVDDSADELGRLADLVDQLPDLPPDLGDRVIRTLSQLDADASDPAVRGRIVSTIRKSVGHHRAYAQPDWAMPSERVDNLEAAAAHLTPDDKVAKHSWLFSQHPDMAVVAGRDYRRYDERLKELRVQAMTDVLSEGWAAAERLLEAVERPWTVGWTLGAGVEGEPDPFDQVVPWVTTGSAKALEGAEGFFAARAEGDGLESTIAAIVDRAGIWDPEATGRLLVAASRERPGWDSAEALGVDVESAYWSRWWGFPKGEAVTQAAQKLLAHGRPLGAVDVLASGLESVEVEFDPQLAEQALIAASEEESLPTNSNDLVMFRYNVGRLLERLERAGVDDGTLARLEWTYLPVLERNDTNRELVLHRELARDPKFFVEILSTVWRASDEKPRDADEPTLRLARRAYELLEAWHRPPGLSDGTIDADALLGWVTDARQLLSDAKRLAIGEQRIGQVLRYVPPGADGVWPHEAVRSLLEELRSQDIETGLQIEVQNSLGVTVRAAGEGGDQERRLEADYRDAANAMAVRWPRTASVLRQIADDFLQQAERWDVDAALSADRRGV